MHNVQNFDNFNTYRYLWGLRQWKNNVDCHCCAVSGIRDILVRPDPYLWLMDPDPTPDPTPFSFDFKRKKIHIFLL